MSKFLIEYTEERPGWDEFNKVRFDSAVITADTKDEAEAKFSEQYKYCFIDKTTEVK